MNASLTLSGVLLLGGFVQAAGIDVSALLKQDLGNAIEVVSEREIRYCPDNTCDVYRVNGSKDATYLSSFVYLHLFHQSDYRYLKESMGGSRPFRELAKGAEPSVRKLVEGFCSASKKTPPCILDGMKETLGITVTFGRYDEGKFNES